MSAWDITHKTPGVQTERCAETLVATSRTTKSVTPCLQAGDPTRDPTRSRRDGSVAQGRCTRCDEPLAGRLDYGVCTRCRVAALPPGLREVLEGGAT